MNRRLGMFAAMLTLVAVLGFAASMLTGSNNGSYLSSILIAWGFVPLICSFAAYAPSDSRALGYTAIALSSVYAVLTGVVYFAQLTTLRLTALSDEARALLTYSPGSLFFNYDLLGYAFMALATFCIAFTVDVRSRPDRWLKGLLLFHGVFAVACTLMPMLGVFRADMPGGDLIGVLVLEFWCVYFSPVCVLAYRYFRTQRASD
jgi:hypothetical protein